MTARMLAWKQPFIQRVRNSSLVEGPRMDNNRVLRQTPKTRDSRIYLVSVGEHSICAECERRRFLERMEKQM